MLYTIDPKDINKIDDSSSIIGKITDGDGLSLYSTDNKLIEASEKFMGYKHF